ncbi:MAG: response regulator [Treponema sp.]|nr:response regulator [Treponema sp.]
MRNERNIVMLVDDDEVCLTMGREILEGKYTLYPVQSGEQAFVILKKVIPDLILLDIEMSGMDGYEVLKRLKQEDSTKDIPVIFLSSRTNPGDELDGLCLGAIDFITKPFSPLLLVQRIENHLLICSQRKELIRYNSSLQKMVETQTKKTMKLQNAVLNTFLEIVEFREKINGGHIERILGYLRKMLDAMPKHGPYRDEVESWDMETLVSAAQMHDIGKIYISEAILNKPGKLSDKEFEEIKKHPTYGLMIIDRIRKQVDDEHPFLDYAAVLAENHHERWDGSGYPKGLKGDSIPLSGRLMALVDVYDALVSIRPYKRPMPPREATEEIIKGAGTAFDPVLVEIFETVSDEFAEIAIRHNACFQHQ